jgi:hypothetical protein
MTRIGALAIVFVMCAAAQADQRAPSVQVLAEMGLAGLQTISDSEALAIRGRGFDPSTALAGFESYEQSKVEFQTRVAEFRARIENHSFRGAARFANSKENFRKHVTSFQGAANRFKQKIH